MGLSIEKIREGDEQAFKELFDEYYQALCVFATTYLKDNALAADIVQESFVKFWGRRSDFNDTFNIKSFLYTIVRNHCLNFIRDNKLKREDLSVLMSDEFYTETLIEDEAYRMFYEAVNALPAANTSGYTAGFGRLEKFRDCRSAGRCRKFCTHAEKNCLQEVARDIKGLLLFGFHISSLIK